MKKYKILLQSENIDYVEVNEILIEDYLEMVNDENVQKSISTKRKTYTYEDELTWVKAKLKEKEIIFSMMERKTGDFIGNIGITNLTEQTTELGITITPVYQNKHYGTEAIKTLIDYCFNNLNIEEIHIVVFSNNERAIHCYKKFGFTEYKRDKFIAFIDNELVDDVHMKLKR